MSCQRETQLKEGENRDMTDSKKSGRTRRPRMDMRPNRPPIEGARRLERKHKIITSIESGDVEDLLGERAKPAASRG